MIPFILSSASNFNTVGSSIGPIIIVALLIDVCIVALWYFIGTVLNNDGIKQSAKGEYYQFLGTVLLVVIVIWAITAYGGIAYTVLGANSSGLMSPSTINNMCTNIESANLINVIGNSSSFLTGAQTPSGDQLVGICSMIDGDTLTDKIDYPLVATAVVTSNLTAQTANNLNGAYTYDAYIGFLSSLSPQIALCFAPPPALQCVVPGGAIIGTYFRMSLTYTPYAGYSVLFDSLGSLGSLLNLSFEAFIAQLLVITIILYVWPWLFFGGIVLRSTFFTRKIGGLLIAIAIGAVVVFPTLFAIEYLTLGNGIPGVTASTPYNATYGFNASSPEANTISPIPSYIYNTSTSSYQTGNYLVNFFVEPSMQQIAQANGCWPTLAISGQNSALKNLLNGVAIGPVGAIEQTGIGSLFASPLAGAELADIFYLVNPITNAASGIGQVVTAIGTAGAGTFYLPSYCPAQGALATTMEMLNAYGIIGVSSYFLPIINLLMTLSAIIGLSGLMGGNTSLEGLSRFV